MARSVTLHSDGSRPMLVMLMHISSCISREEAEVRMTSGLFQVSQLTRPYQTSVVDTKDSTHRVDQSVRAAPSRVERGIADALILPLSQSFTQSGMVCVSTYCTPTQLTQTGHGTMQSSTARSAICPTRRHTCLRRPSRAPCKGATNKHKLKMDPC